MDNKLATLLEGFFNEWIKNNKKFSQNTIWAYKDTLRLLLKYAAKRLKQTPSAIDLEILDAEFICDFLQDLETNRKVCSRTRNLRASAIKTFFRYVSWQMPERNAQAARILAIEESKIEHPQTYYLTEHELQALLKVQKMTTVTGRRDHTMILLGSETGMRISEMTSLQWEDIHMTKCNGFIKCMGKGRKERSIPLSSWTLKALKDWKTYMKATCGYVFPNRSGSRMSIDCFEKQLKKYVKLAIEFCLSLKAKNITPHSLRHTAAMNLVLADVDMFTIAIILGHESLKTTQTYLQADPRLKERALKKLKPKNIEYTRFKPDDKLISFLKSR